MFVDYIKYLKLIRKTVIVTSFCSLVLLPGLINATPIVDVQQSVTEVGSEWNYDFIITNTSDSGELIYDFFLDFSSSPSPGRLLSGITQSSPDWSVLYTDNQNEIWWAGGIGAEIAVGDSLQFSFLSDELIAEITVAEFAAIDSSGIPLSSPAIQSISPVNPSVSVSEPASWLLFLLGLAGFIFYSKRLVRYQRPDWRQQGLAAF